MTVEIINGINVKRCSRCKEFIPVEYYYADRTRKDKLNHR